MINRFICGLALTALTGIVHSAEQVPAEEELVVTATRSEKKALDIPSAVTVLTQAEMSVSLPANIADVLDALAAADIRRAGGTLGGTTSLSTRGTSSDHTLMLINGQRFSSATLGQAAFELIDPAMVKRLEYIRGSRSSLYGSDALGGVMQLFTYDENKETQLVAGLEAGTFDTYKATLNGSVAAGPAYVNGGFSHTMSDGFDHLTDDTALNSDDDPFERNAASVFASVDLPNDAELSASYIDVQTRADYDSLWVPEDQPFRDKTLSALQTRLYLPFGEMFSTDLSLGQSKDEAEEKNRVLGDSPATSVFDTERFSAYWQNNLSISDIVELVAGIDYIDEQVAGSVSYVRPDRTNTAPFVQADADFGVLNVLLGYRNEDNSQFGSYDTGSVSANLRLSEKNRIYLSWNEGFKAPTFNDLYWPDSGNADLKPEESENWELGFKRGSGSQEIEFIAFKSDIANLIDWAPIEPGSFIWRPQNVGEAEISGVEGRFSQRFQDVRLEISGSYISPKDKVTDEDLNFRSRRKIAATITHELGKWHYGALLRAYGQRKNGVSNLDAYELIDFFVNFQPIKQLSLGAKVTNSADQDYEQTGGYNAEGRNYRFSIKYEL